jgi:large subunit ribosomal protein L29
MRAADLREKGIEDLRELQKSLVRDVFQNRLKNFTNRLDDTSAMRKTKRDLARVATLLRESDLGIVRKPTAADEANPTPEPKAARKPKEKVAEVEASPDKTPAKAKKATAPKKSKKSEGKQP